MVNHYAPELVVERKKLFAGEMEREDRAGSEGGGEDAEGGGGSGTAANIPSGRVEQVRAQWSVHEDGALAYHLQNEEISGKANFNRNQRQTVSEGEK